MGDGRATSDAPFQQVPRAGRPAAEAESGGEVGVLIWWSRQLGVGTVGTVEVALSKIHLLNLPPVGILRIDGPGMTADSSHRA